MIRIAVIGYGYWGPNLVRNFQETEGAKVAICCDTNHGAGIREQYSKRQATLDRWNEWFECCKDFGSLRDVHETSGPGS